MINPKSRSLEWITEAARQIGVHDIALVEKTIRAFSLLEALTRSGCPFIFKGGSSLMLHLNTSKRLSIDIDIICPPGTVIEEYLSQYAEEYGFGNVELVERISRTDVPKQHAKFYYEVSYPSNGGQDKIPYWQFHSQREVHFRFCHRQCSQSGLPQPTFGERD